MRHLTEKEMEDQRIELWCRRAARLAWLQFAMKNGWTVKYSR